MPDDPKPYHDPNQLGYPGYPAYSGRSWAGADEFHRELTGTLADKKFVEMQANHGLILTSRILLTALAQQTRWDIQAASTEPAALAAAEAVKAAWSNMETPWRRVLGELMTAVFWGWSFHEVVYQADSRGRITGLRGLYFCRQDTRQSWHWTPDNREVRALEQLTRAGQHATIPTAKALHLVLDTSTASPEGMGFLRALYLDYRDQMQVRTATLIGLQKDATGTLSIRVPVELWVAATAGDTTATTQLTAIQQAAARFQRGEREALVLPGEKDAEDKPTGWGAKLLSGGGRRQFDHEALIQLFERRIATTLLTQFLLLGQKAGSFALSSDQTELMGVTLGGILDLMASAITQQVYRPLTQLLGFDAALCPALVHGPIDRPSLEALAALLTAGNATGLLKPDASLEAHIRDVAGFPAATTAEDGV